MAVPEEAMRRRRELSHGAWHLYEQYCKHRNRDTGQCDPLNSTLAREMKCSYTHVSDCKAELVKKGWVRRDGRQQVDLLVGTFPPPKVRNFGKFRNSTSENSEVDSPNFGKFRNSTSENSVTGSGAPSIYEPGDKPGAAAAPAAPADAWKKELCDESYVAEVKRDGTYPHALVDYVWSKLKRRCRQEKVEPTKGRFEYWLSIEKGTPVQQPSLLEPPVADGRESFQASKPERPLLAPDPQCGMCGGEPAYRNEFGATCDCRVCRVCFGSGMEVVKGKGARRCRCRLPAAEAARESEAPPEEIRQAQGGSS